MRQLVPFVIPAALALSLAAPVAYGDLNTAQAAYNREDYAAAFEEFLTLAEQGDAVAQSSVGVLYDEGKGVARDFDKAVSWYRKSADQGNQFGQFNLGTMYYLGAGTEKDLITACSYFMLATLQGNGPARRHMQLCEKHLDESQRGEYVKRANDWLAQHKKR